MHVERLIQLKPDEEILEVVHEEFVAHAPKFALLFCWFVLPFFFLFPLFRLGWIGGLFFFLLFGSASFALLRAFFRWAYTVLIVTDQRVIDIEQKGLFDRTVTETPYQNIDEASYRVKGFIPTLFRYGDVTLKLAGSAADIVFHRVKRPVRLHDLVNDLCLHSRQE